MGKSKSGKVIAIAMLFLNLFVSVPAIAETYTPQDPGSIYDDLTGNYGVLGIASQFHVFSKGKTTINAHTNGNIATKELDANNNFGTDIISGDLQLEINYVQKTDSLIGSSLTSGNDKRVNKFVVGESVKASAENDKAVINGSRIDHLTLEEFYQDQPGKTYIDFASEFSQLANISDFMMTLAPTQTVTSADFPDVNNRSIVLTGKSNSNFILANVDAAVLQTNTPLNISNPENKVVVLNVINAPADFTVQSQIRYNGRNNQETEDFSDANLSWNFGTSMTNLAIDAPFQGTIIAPNTDITVNQNMDGTIIGNNVVLNAATNRWDPNEIFPIDVPDDSDSTTNTTDTTSESTTDTTSESTTEPSTSTTDSTSESTTESSTTDTTSKSTTEPSTSTTGTTSESTTEPSTTDSTSESTTESSTTDTTSKSTTEPSTSTTGTTSESTTEPSTTDTTSESTTEPSTSTTDTTSETTTEPSTTDTTSESTTESSTTDTTSESTTEPSTTDTTSESTTEPSTTDTTSETTTEPSTSTTDTTSESTTEPSTSTTDTTSKTTTEPSTTTTSPRIIEPDTTEPSTTETSTSSSTHSSNNGAASVIAGKDSSSSNVVTNNISKSDAKNMKQSDQAQKNNKESDTLPRTNSTSNRWFAVVGIVVILMVITYLIYRRKKF